MVLDEVQILRSWGETRTTTMTRMSCAWVQTAELRVSGVKEEGKKQVVLGSNPQSRGKVTSS